MHQDKLLWSRMQYVSWIQGAVLAGMYNLKGDIALTGALAALGVILTGFVVMLMIRDDKLGTQAFVESGVPKTVQNSYTWFKGRYFAFATTAIFAVADVALFVYLL